MKAFCSLLLIALTAGSHAQVWDWVKGSKSTGHIGPAGLCTDPQGNVYMLANSNGSGSIEGAGLVKGTNLVKVNASGQPIWFTPLTFTPHAMGVDDGGNIYLLINFIDPLHTKTKSFTSKGHYDFAVVRLDNQGNEQWALAFGDTNYNVYRGFAVDNAGTLFITGTCNSNTMVMGSHTIVSSEGHQAFLAAFDGSGQVTWLKKVAQPGGYFAAYSGNLALYNDELVTIVRGDSLCIVHYSKTGQELQVKKFPGNFKYGIEKMQMDGNGNCFLQVDGGRYEQGAIVRLNQSLQPQWTYDLGMAWSCDYACDWLVDKNGDLVLCGHLSPDEGYCGSSGRQSHETFVRDINGTTGKEVWTKTAADLGSDIAYAITVDDQNNLFVAGAFNVGCVHSPHPMNLYSAFDNFKIKGDNNIQELYLAKLDPTGVTALTESKVESRSLDLFPNPAGNYIKIQGAQSGDVISVTTLQGLKAATLMVSHEGQIDISDLPAGIYIVSLQQHNSSQVRKLVVAEH